MVSCNIVAMKIYPLCRRYVQKVSRLKLYYPEHKLTITRTLIFFKIVPIVFNTLIPMSLLLVEAPLKLLFLYVIKVHCYISFDVFPVHKSWDEFSFRRRKRKSHRGRCGGKFGECYTCTILFCQKLPIKKSIECWQWLM